MARAEAYLHAKFHLDPSNRLATIHQRYSQTGQTDRQDRQRIDSIGRTVLQTVAQKLILCRGWIQDVLVTVVCGMLTGRSYKHATAEDGSATIRGLRELSQEIFF